jgi:hypothetical protein
MIAIDPVCNMTVEPLGTRTLGGSAVTPPSPTCR